MNDTKLITYLAGGMMVAGLFDVFSGNWILGLMQIGLAGYGAKRIL